MILTIANQHKKQLHTQSQRSFNTRKVDLVPTNRSPRIILVLLSTSSGHHLTKMAPSVSFADQLVTDSYEVPRLSKNSIPDYFYSREDIARFQRIWKSIILQRMKGIEDDRRGESNNATKRTRPENSDQHEQPKSTKRSRCFAEKEEIVQTKAKNALENINLAARSVSPVEQLEGSR